MGPLFSVPR